ASKDRACEEAGLRSVIHDEPANLSHQDLLALVERLNADPEVDGILVQLPLPDQVDADRVLEAIDPAKDVDGFHAINAGALAQGRPRLVPCTPAGIIELLRREEIPMVGARAVVMGRSLIVGRPMALLLIGEHATVTVVHSRTRDLPGVCREADILVAAIGRPAMVTDQFVKPGATVIDVGINRVTDADQARDHFGAESRRFARFRENGTTLVGDVHPRLVAPVAGALTPVPGGVGPLTVAMLLKNTLAAYRARHSQGAGS
ncbi:MAG: bifunctional 5,10-methylenetetrahydrofolate dehydrogenase/5,10-methenyltetrahydrofolate cyclohydrolase, partial [Acidobacteria bacterium]|nr:bifunctional 5,10-methylenetetrahydrofolate dehydrogenase/5,10-methenyltetrahydrofolate cyclohydrolase [Acidobacteriota bacterium]